MGHGHARLGEVPEGRRDVGRDPLSLRLHGLEARGARPRAGRGTLMTAVAARRGCFALVIVWLCAVAMGSVRVQGQAADVGTEAQRAAGKVLYDKNCAQCHGDKGDSAGYATPHLFPRPRDFTTPRFKVRTTPNGA